MNGYKNYETWNVTLWLANDETFYNILIKYIHTAAMPTWNGLVRRLRQHGIHQTPDGVAFTDALIDDQETVDFMLSFAE